MNLTEKERDRAERFCSNRDCIYYAKTGYIFCEIHLHGRPTELNDEDLLLKHRINTNHCEDRSGSIVIEKMI